MIVVDANILIRAILGRQVRQLLDRYAAQGLRFFAADVAFEDAQKYLPAILKKRGKGEVDVPGSLAYLRTIIEPIDRELYTYLKVRHATACVAKTRTIGQCWPVLWR